MHLNQTWYEKLGKWQKALTIYEQKLSALNDGATFGEGGTGFMRLNVAAPRCVMEQAMRQLAEAYEDFQVE